MFKKNHHHLQPALIRSINELAEKLCQRLANSWADVLRPAFLVRIQAEPLVVVSADIPSQRVRYRWEGFCKSPVD